jgi:hypothetical protein
MLQTSIINIKLKSKVIAMIPRIISAICEGKCYVQQIVVSANKISSVKTICKKGEKIMDRLFYITKGTFNIKEKNCKEICAHEGTLIYLPSDVEYTAYWEQTDIASYIRLKFSYKCPFSTVELSKPLFSHPTFHSSLVFLDSKNDSDLSFINYNDSLYTKAIDNIIRLHTLAKQQNINLIYLIAADKYDVYSEYIKNNPFPVNLTLDKFKIDENWFINSKAIFQRHLQQGMKDIYYVNDTHWSPIGAQIIGEYIGNIIQDIHNNTP